MLNKRSLILFAVFSVLIFSVVEVFSEEIVVYSARKKALTKKPFRSFSIETGIDINLVTGEIDELLEKLKKEGKNSPADILMTVDAGSLWEATQAGLLQPVNSDVLTRNIPEHLRDPENHWFGLSKHARTIVYSKERVDPSELSTYADLAEPKWNNKLCLRTSRKVYNQSLVAMMIESHGIEETERIIKGWVRNLAVAPYEKDTDVIIGINDGKCDVGIVNHYYLARMLKTDQKIPVGLLWPDQGEGEGGVFVDIAGAGITKYAKNKDLAVKFLNWLSSEKAQNIFADSNMEYPVNPDVEPSNQVQAWGDFMSNTENISHAGENRTAAIQLMQRAGYK